MSRLRQIAQGNPSILARALEHQATWEDTFSELLVQRLPEGSSTEMRARVVAGAVMAAIRIALDMWTDSDSGCDLSDILDEAFDVLGDGLGNSLGET